MNAHTVATSVEGLESVFVVVNDICFIVFVCGTDSAVASTVHLLLFIYLFCGEAM